MLNGGLQEGDSGGGLLPEATLQNLVWQTAHVLRELLNNDNSENALQYLAEPLDDGPYVLRIDQLLAIVRKALNPITISQHLLCASFLLVLNLAMTKAFQNEEFVSLHRSDGALMALHLLLHQPRTWGLAMELVPFVCDADQAPSVRARLQQLQNYIDNTLKVFFG